MTNLDTIKQSSHYINNILQNKPVNLDKLRYSIHRNYKKTINALKSSIRLRAGQTKPIPGISIGTLSFIGNSNDSSNKIKWVFNIATSCLLDARSIILDSPNDSLINNVRDLLDRYETIYFLVKNQIHSFVYRPSNNVFHRDIKKARELLTKKYGPHNQQKILLLMVQQKPRQNFKVQHLVCYVSRKRDKEFWRN